MHLTFSNLAIAVLVIVVHYLILKVVFLVKQLITSAKVVKQAKQFYQKRKLEIESVSKKIPPCTLASDLYQQIIRSDATQLKALLQQGVVTSEQLVNIFAHRATTIGSSLNLITDVMYDEALAQAKACDQLRKNNPDACTGELFGVPISLKEQFEVKGKSSTWGCFKWTSRVSQDDGAVTKIIKMAGGIPFVLTTLPQCAMNIESDSILYGRACNPWNKERTTGGSSGGEGGLVGACCSPLGVGTDIGGSIRIPSAFCGLVGFKPTAQRVSMKGVFVPSKCFKGFQAVGCTIGPLGRSVDDNALAMQAILSEKYRNQLDPKDSDPFYLLKPFDSKAYQDRSKKFKIGFIKSYDMFTSHIAQQRAIEMARDALQAQGHELVEISLPDTLEQVQLFSKVNFSDNLASYHEIAGGEPLHRAYQLIEMLCHLPKCVKYVISKVLACAKQDRLALSVVSINPSDAKEYRLNSYRIMEQQEKIIGFCRDLKLDAIISPGFGMPALKHGLSRELILSAGCTIIWNVLNFPTGVVPITVVQENEQHYANDPYKDLMHNFAVQNMKNSAGLPVAVQVSTLPLEEEKCLNIMKQLEEKIQFSKAHPYKTAF